MLGSLLSYVVQCFELSCYPKIQGWAGWQIGASASVAGVQVYKGLSSTLRNPNHVPLVIPLRVTTHALCPDTHPPYWVNKLQPNDGSGDGRKDFRSKH